MVAIVEAAPRTGPTPLSSQSIEAVVTSLDQGLVLVNAGGAVTYCNKRLPAMLGLDAMPCVGNSYKDLFRSIARLSHAPQQTEAKLLAVVSDLDTSPTLDIGIRHPMDSQLTLKFFPVVGDDATAWGCIVQTATPNPAHVVQQTEHLTTLTHGLRSSVATIKGFVTTLLSGHRYWGDSERQGFLESIDENVDQLSRLLENAQEVLRLESGEVELDCRPTDVKRLIQRVINSLGLQRSGHVFNLEAAEDLPAAEIDPLRIEQVLHNVLASAVKFAAREKTVDLVLQARGDDLQVSLVDPASHLSRDDMMRIFDGFYQFDGSDSTLGLSIGLYVARGLIMAHGGRIWAENGSTSTSSAIHFTLPLKARPQAHVAVAEPSSRLARRTSALMGSRAAAALEARPARDMAKILVVDDDAQMLRLLKIKLEVEGFEVVTSTRGNNALELVVVEQPDVILLDVSLPDSNGFDICARLREFTTVPIIMITGQSREEDMVRGLDSGADDYLIKPVRNRELLARVRANIRRSRVPEQSTAKPVFSTGELSVDFAQRQVVVRSKPVRLTPTEYKLLYHLAANAGRILTHSQLLSKVWGPGYEEDTQYLWVNISRLRGKIERDPGSPEYILTEPGVGYYVPDNQSA